MLFFFYFSCNGCCGSSAGVKIIYVLLVIVVNSNMCYDGCCNYFRLGYRKTNAVAVFVDVCM